MPSRDNCLQKTTKNDVLVIPDPLHILLIIHGHVSIDWLTGIRLAMARRLNLTAGAGINGRRQLILPSSGNALTCHIDRAI